jgi:N-acetylglucosaminyl-diphospho-decaprenol L-rhamnosyltransferase
VSYAAVIVLHESRAELARLLETLDRLTHPPRLVVVDTGEDDGGADLAALNGAEVLLMRDNPGYGAANNEALRHVHEDVAILLNPDTEILDDSLERLADIARKHPDELHAPRLLNPDGSVQRSAHPQPGTLGAFLPALIPSPLLPAAVRRRAEPYRSVKPTTVGWAIGACLAATTDRLRRLGPFDPAIHLFGEDMDLGLRATTVYHPGLVLIHHGGHSVNRAGERFEDLARTRREVIGRRRGARARRLDDVAQALTFATRAFKGPRERAQLRALLEARR